MRVLGGIIIETEHDRMEQALKTWRLMNSCRDRSDGNSSRSSIPDSFRVLPSLALPPPPSSSTAYVF